MLTVFAAACASAAVFLLQANHDETLRASQQLAAKQQELAEARKRQLEAMGGAAGAQQAMQYCATCCIAVHSLVSGARARHGLGRKCHACCTWITCSDAQAAGRSCQHLSSYLYCTYNTMNTLLQSSMR
jgi:hypothetical protein